MSVHRFSVVSSTPSRDVLQWAMRCASRFFDEFPEDSAGHTFHNRRLGVSCRCYRNRYRTVVAWVEDGD